MMFWLKGVWEGSVCTLWVKILRAGVSKTCLNMREECGNGALKSLGKHRPKRIVRVFHYGFYVGSVRPIGLPLKHVLNLVLETL